MGWKYLKTRLGAVGRHRRALQARNKWRDSFEKHLMETAALESIALDDLRLSAVRRRRVKAQPALRAFHFMAC